MTGTLTQKIYQIAINVTRSWKQIGFDMFLLCLATTVVLGIVWIKSRTVAEFLTDPLLLVYTFFVTLFQLSRIVSALLYKSSYNTALATNSQDTYTPSITFVIPCMNEGEAIFNTIENCCMAEYPKELIEVIVINGGSTDNTQAEIMRAQEQFPTLVAVNWEHNRGKRHGMAEGFWRARGEIGIQIDSDSFIDPQTVRAMITPFQNPSIGALSAHTDPMNPDVNILTKMQTAYYFMSFRILKAAESTFYTVFCCSGCASAYRKEAVLPFLDAWLEERFLGLPVTWGDDRAITNRVIKAGYGTLYTDEVRAYTIVPSTLKQFIKQQIRWKKGLFVNSVFASKFIIKREPFVAFTYFFPLLLVTILTPFMAIRAFVYTPLTKGFSASAYYMLGVLFITLLIMTVYRFLSPENKYWPYLFLWALINMFLLSCLLLFALATIQDRKWGTRSLQTASP